jgi:hypothetical protein
MVCPWLEELAIYIYIYLHFLEAKQNKNSIGWVLHSRAGELNVDYVSRSYNETIALPLQRPTRREAVVHKVRSARLCLAHTYT